MHLFKPNLILIFITSEHGYAKLHNHALIYVPGCTIHVDIILYHTCTYYNCLPEDEPSGLKHVHVEDSMKIKIKFSFKWCILVVYIK